MPSAHTAQAVGVLASPPNIAIAVLASQPSIASPTNIDSLIRMSKDTMTVGHYVSPITGRCLHKVLPCVLLRSPLNSSHMADVHTGSHQLR